MKTIATIGLTTSLLLGASSLVADSARGHIQRSGDSNLHTATFSMYCYWTGEATLGRVEGVVASRIGHWSGAEIVQVDYDPERTSVGELARALKKQRSFDSLVVDDPAQRHATASDLEPDDIDVRSGKPHFIEPKHSLRTRNPDLMKLGLSESQAIALNSWSYFGGSRPDVLTAEQKAELAQR